jgi:hypothetical protein
MYVKTMLVAATAVIGVGLSEAKASDWYAIDQEHAVCIWTGNVPPASIRDSIRSQGHSEETKVYRDNSGTVTAVAVEDKTTNISYFFFTTQNECQYALNKLLQGGLIPNPSDLN